jgi:uncharacterized protein YkwD
MPRRLSFAARATMLAAALSLSIPFSPLTSKPAHAQFANCDVSDADLELDGAEFAMLDAINAYRSELGLPGFGLAPSLVRGAQWKAFAMAGGAAFDHNDPDRTWDQRIIDCGYPADAYFSENLGYDPTFQSIESQLQDWKNSQLHDDNLRSTVASHIGIARVEGPSAIYWVLVFGNIEA